MLKDSNAEETARTAARDEIVAAATPISRIHISDKGRFGFSHIDAEEQGVEALGYVVINRVLGGVLQASLGTMDSLELFCPARVIDVKSSPSRTTVTVADSTGDALQLSCDLLVAADGSNSAVRGERRAKLARTSAKAPGKSGCRNQEQL